MTIHPKIKKNAIQIFLLTITSLYSVYFYTGQKYRALDFSEFNSSCYDCDIKESFRDYEVNEFEQAIKNSPDPSFIAKITERRRYYVHDAEMERTEFMTYKFLFYLSIIVSIILLVAILKNLNVIYFSIIAILGLNSINSISDLQNSNGKIAHLRDQQNQTRIELEDEISKLQECCNQNKRNQSITISYY